MTDPSVVALQDQAKAADADFLRTLDEAGIAVRQHSDAGPVARAVIYRMHVGIAAGGLKVCGHVAADRTEPAAWYAHRADTWACTGCHGQVLEPEVCDHCGDDLDTRHVVCVHLSPPASTTAVNPPLLIVMTLCAKCAAVNDIHDQPDETDDPGR